jgi:hypothetical protein
MIAGVLMLFDNPKDNAQPLINADSIVAINRRLDNIEQILLRNQTMKP